MCGMSTTTTSNETSSSSGDSVPFGIYLSLLGKKDEFCFSRQTEGRWVGVVLLSGCITFETFLTEPPFGFNNSTTKVAEKIAAAKYQRVQRIQFEVWYTRVQDSISYEILHWFTNYYFGLHITIFNLWRPLQLFLQPLRIIYNL
jgi:hypothetical protein